MAVEEMAALGLEDHRPRLEVCGAWRDPARLSQVQRDTLNLSQQGSSPCDVLAWCNGRFPAGWVGESGCQPAAHGCPRPQPEAGAGQERKPCVGWSPGWNSRFQPAEALTAGCFLGRSGW